MNLLEIPKAELHRHLELSLRDETIKEIAPEFGFDLSKEGSFEHHFKILSPMEDLGSALHKFLDTQKLFGNTEILERIAYEACEDAYKKEGIRVLELRYAPTFVALNQPNLTFSSIHEAFKKGIARAEKDFPMAVGMIGILQRILPVEENLKVMNFMVENKDSFIGVDLADNEVGFDPAPFAPCFDLAKEHGLRVTVHAGEAQEAGSERNILDSVHKLHAERIGHGIQCHRDEEVLKYVVENKIPLEVCPTSNVLTGAVSSLKEHPIRTLIDKGCYVTISSDDPGIFNQNTLEDYQALLDNNLLTIDELKTCSDNAARASFIDKEKLNSSFKTKKELHIARKLWHMCGVLAIGYLYYIIPYQKMIYLGAVLTTFFVLLDFARLQFESLNKVVQFIMSPFIRKEEKNNLSGLSFMAVGTYVTALLFPKEIVLLAFAFLGLGDPTASFFGVLYGKNKIGSKSLEGTFACFLICTLAASIYFAYNNFFGHRIFIVVPIAGLIGAACELIQIKQFDDNMTLPLFSGFGLWTLFYIFGL